MSPYLLLPLLAFIFNLGLARFVFRGQWRAPGHRVFALFLLGMAAWGGFIFLMRSSPTPEDALIWDKLVIITFSVISVLYLQSTYGFGSIRPPKYLFPVAYGMLAVWAYLTFQGLVVKEMQRNFYGYAPVLEAGFYPYIVFTYAVLSLGVYNVTHTLRHSTSPALRNRAYYLLAGTLYSVLGGTTDYLAALGLPMYPLGIVGNILFALFATIAMANERLVDIRRTFRRAVAYIVAAALLLIVYAAAATSASQFFNVSLTTSSITLTLVFAGTVGIAWPHLMTWAEQWVDVGFYRQRYGPLKALERFSQETRDITDLDTLATSLVTMVRVATRTQFVSLLLPRGRGNTLQSAVTAGIDETFQLSYRTRSAALDRLAREDRVVSVEEARLFPEWEGLPLQEKEKFDVTDVQLFVPLKSKAELSGLLIVGPKPGGKGFTQEDIDLLQTVARQASTSMENARLYQELSNQLVELKETQAQLIQSAKLASVGTLAAGVAHEISNPILSISGRAELLLQDASMHLKSAKAEEYMSVIFEMSERVTTVVRELLTYSRQDGEFTPLLVNSLLDHTLHLVEDELRTAGVEVQRQYADDLPSVVGVGNKLQQVVMNLVLNARDAMPGGGTITLTTTAKNGRVLISFADNGEGIPKDRLSRIFDAFYTTKDVGKGTGLGLYITQRIVQEHKGQITVESELRRGTSFTVSLPASPVEASQPETPVTTAGTDAG